MPRLLSLCANMFDQVAVALLLLAGITFAYVIGIRQRDPHDEVDDGALAHPHRFFRPFGQGGNLDERLLNPVVVDVLTAERMSCVLWNAIPGDWKEPDAWVDRALAQCRVQAWTVMVLHDLPTGAMRNLERFLER